ncbi:MAG: hypothetical protein ACYDHZ_01015 [Dehalococcoidia bacterium]|jgi:hypothetical protein
MMEDKIVRFISKLNTDKVRLTELIAHFTHDVSGTEKEAIIFKKILPALLNMEKTEKIKLSWDVLLTRYRFPRYIYTKSEETDEARGAKLEQPLWQKQIEDILKKDASLYHKKVRELRLQDKFEKFVKKYEKSSEEIAPSEDWIKIITAVMETNLSQYDVMRACIEAFKAGAVWEKYRKEFEE